MQKSNRNLTLTLCFESVRLPPCVSKLSQLPPNCVKFELTQVNMETSKEFTHRTYHQNPFWLEK